MKTDDTRRGSWYEQKMIPAANGKEYGPYWYLRRRDGAHTRSIYIGKRLRLIGDTRAAADIRPLGQKEENMKRCKKCNIQYDGPPENFPKSGMCPACDPETAGLYRKEMEALAKRYDAEERARAEMNAQAAEDADRQYAGERAARVRWPG